MSWSTKRLDECVKFLSGGTPNKSKPEYWDGDIPWVSSAEMTERFLADTSLNITQAGLEAGSRLVPAGTTFAVVRGMSLAKEFRISLAQRAMAFNQDVKALIPKPGFDGRFIFYSLAAHATAIRDLATEAAHGTKKLEMDRLEGYVIQVPNDIETQRIVASVAYAYDELITTNQRRIALLEDAVHRLYREWFVQLRFPGHEAVLMKDEIPEGWQIKALGAIAPLRYGKALKATDRKDGKVPVFGSSGIVGTHDVALVDSGAIVVGRKGNVGSLYFSPVPCFPIDTVFYIESAQASYWLFLALHQLNFISSDSAVPGLNRTYAHSLSLLQPSSAVAAAFERLVQPMFRQSQKLIELNAQLARARDLLLPKLMSGQLDVSGIPLPDEVAA